MNFGVLPGGPPFDFEVAPLAIGGGPGGGPMYLGMLPGGPPADFDVAPLTIGTVAIGPTSVDEEEPPNLAFVVVPDPNPGLLVAAPVARPAKPAIAAAAAASLPTIELAGDVVA